MSLSEVEIAAVVAELSALEGWVVQRVWAPRQRTVILRLRAPGESRLLLLAGDPPLTRLHLVSARPPAASEPPPFQAALRAEIEGLRLESITQLPGERIVSLSLTGRHRRRLVAELMGRAGNVLVLDEDGSILHAAATTGGRKRAAGSGEQAGSRRDIRPGRRYAPPPTPAKARAGAERFRFTEAMGDDFPFSRAVEAHYAPLERERGLEEKKRSIRKPLRAALVRTERALLRLDEEERRAREAATYRRYGELLKSSLHQIERGSGEARVVDWYAEDQPTVGVPLRPELSPKENLDRYFRLARRLGGAREKIEERREELGARRARLSGLLSRLEKAEEEGAVEELGEEARSAGIRGLEPSTSERTGKPAEKVERRPYRRYLSATGRPILVGRGSKENDELTFKVAKGNDLWLHVRGRPGSHVVVPMGKEEEPDQETLLDAATLAAHFSGERGERMADVAWTRRKHVRKPRGSPPGMVSVSGERGLLLRVEEERLKRLLGGP